MTKHGFEVVARSPNVIKHALWTASFALIHGILAKSKDQIANGAIGELNGLWRESDKGPSEFGPFVCGRAGSSDWSEIIKIGRDKLVVKSSKLIIDSTMGGLAYMYTKLSDTEAAKAFADAVMDFAKIIEEEGTEAQVESYRQYLLRTKIKVAAKRSGIEV